MLKSWIRISSVVSLMKPIVYLYKKKSEVVKAIEDRFSSNIS